MQGKRKLQRFGLDPFAVDQLRKSEGGSWVRYTDVKDLVEPDLVEPPDCACQGKAPQMREHTKDWCSVYKTADVNEALRS